MRRHETRRSCCLIEADLQREPLPTENSLPTLALQRNDQNTFFRREHVLSVKHSTRKGCQKKDEAAP